MNKGCWRPRPWVWEVLSTVPYPQHYGHDAMMMKNKHETAWPSSPTQCDQIGQFLKFTEAWLNHCCYFLDNFWKIGTLFNLAFGHHWTIFLEKFGLFSCCYKLCFNWLFLAIGNNPLMIYLSSLGILIRWKWVKWCDICFGYFPAFY